MGLSRRKEALLGRLRRRRTREREGLFMVEGVRSVTEALDHAADARFAVCAPRLREIDPSGVLMDRLAATGLEVTWVDDDELTLLSDTEAPQGVLLVCGEPAGSLDDLQAQPGADGGILILDGLQDPGNVGTLVRVAAAFGLDGVLALDGTVDPFNPKAVRAAAGGLFHTRLVRASWEETAPWLKVSRRALLASDAAGEDVAGLTTPDAWALAVGNEGRGCREDLVRSADGVVAIPMRGGAESLNAGVAGAVLVYALARTSSSGAPNAATGDPEAETS